MTPRLSPTRRTTLKGLTASAAMLASGAAMRLDAGEGDEKIEPLHQEAERDYGDGGAHPRQESAFIGKGVAGAIQVGALS